MFRAQVVERDILADIAVQLELNAALFQLLIAQHYDVFFQLEAGDAVDQQPSGAVVAIIDRDLEAHSTQAIRCGQTARPGANDANAFRTLSRGFNRVDPAFFERHVGQVFFDRTDCDGAMAGLFDDAVAFAQTILRADASANLWECVGRLAHLIGLAQATFGGQFQPVRDVVVEGAMRLAKRHAALAAPRRLLRRFFSGELAVDFIEILAAVVSVALFRRLTLYINELQHFLSHAINPPSLRFQGRWASYKTPSGMKSQFC